MHWKKIIASCAIALTLGFAGQIAPAQSAPQAGVQDWWKNAVIYEIYPRSFQDSNGDGVGDLNGITQRLDYLKDIGVDAIWLTPCYPSPQVDFGYDISDYENIDPQYGTLQDFDRLVDEAYEPLPPVRVVDFHCELTSEKNAFGIYLDGRASAVVGTHTHVPTADERIMPRGTAYQTDLGMCGPVHSVIGFDPATVIPRFINGLPTRFEVGTGPVVFNACQIDVDPDTGRALAVERVQRIVEV